MKLYRVMVVGSSSNIERGVWADRVDFNSESMSFYKKTGEFDVMSEEIVDLVAIYPTSKTIITHIETQEEYEKRTNIKK
jgi:hypothetical protein